MLNMHPTHTQLVASAHTIQTQQTPNAWPTGTQHIINKHSTCGQHTPNTYSIHTQHVANLHPTHMLHSFFTPSCEIAHPLTSVLAEPETSGMALQFCSIWPLRRGCITHSTFVYFTDMAVWLHCITHHHTYTSTQVLKCSCIHVGGGCQLGPR